MPDTREEPVSGSGRIKDDNSVNREIATLLLNLASRTTSNTTSEPEAMDLSKYSRVRNNNCSNTSAATPSHQVSSQTTAATTSPQLQQHNPYNIPSSLSSLPIPSAALNNPSLAANIGSSYLLQNLLIGQIQNLTGTSAPAQPASQATHHLQQSCQPTNLDTDTLQKSNNNAAPLPLNLGTSTIPLLSGHIVAQLNNLLFSVHGLADKNVELNVQTQLTAIYSRLQEIVTMVNMTKKKESSKSKAEATSLVTSSTAKEDKQGELRMASDEQKITRQLEEYQRALYNKKSETAGQTNSNQNMAKIFGGQLNSSPAEPLKLDINGRNKSCEKSPESVEVSSVLESLRRRSSKDSYQESPPEKRLRASVSSHGVMTPGSGADSPQPTSSGRAKSGGKGGKGIRNRVFCGDCVGCLKNDDCGQCRYCRDKTKFGGQNRLRQKCLHRRCQMDTHRRSNGNAGTPLTGGSSPTSVGYSGVDLALYQRGQQQGGGGGGGDNDAEDQTGITRQSSHHNAIAEHSIFTSLLGTSLRDKREEKTPENDNIGAGDTTQSSRSDKWKAKHEAMLKLAVGPKQNISSGSLRNDTDGSSEESEEREPASAEKHVFENRNLVITIKDALKENTENQSVKETDTDERRADRSKAKSSERNNKSKASDSKKDVTRLTTRSMKPVFAL